MKKFSKILSVALLVALVLSLGIASAFADGTDGSVTVENATVGVTYKAYKVFDATFEGDAIAYTASQALYESLGGTTTATSDLVVGPFTISKTADDTGNHNVQLTDPSTSAATIAAWITTNLSKFTEVAATSGLDSSKKATENTVVFGNLAYGYYYVTSGLGGIVSVDSAKKAVVIKDKNPQKPDGPDKEITKEDAVINASDQEFDAPGVKENDAAVGTKESFKITYTATNYVTETANDGTTTSKKVLKFYIDDQPRNLTIDPTTVAVTVGSTSVISAGAVVDASGHPATVSVASGDAGKLSITIDWVDGNGDSIYAAVDGQANISVTLTYDATVLPGAAVDNGDNTVTVLYDREGDNNVKVGDDETDTYTYKFKLNKVDNAGEGLKGAKFELMLGDTKVSVVATADGYRVAKTGEENITTTLDMGENTSIIITGLDKKDYSLVETEAPKGFNKLAAPVSVSKDVLVKANETITDEVGVEHDAGVVTVENNKGTELPSTGGIGTTIFYAVGGILVLAAIVLLITKKRMSE